MAAGTFTFYDSAAQILMGGADLNGATNIIVTLHTSSYTPSAAHNERADLTNQLATEGGYTQDNKALANCATTSVTNGFKFSSDAVVWTATALGINEWKYAVFSITGTVDGLTNPLIGYFEGESGSTIPETTNTNTLTLTPNANGWFDVTHA